MLTNVKKTLTIALATIAVTAATSVFAGDAFARGGKGGHHFHRFHRGGIFLSTPVYSSCWKWIGNRKVWICSY
jgi:hypothetical protein